MHLQLLELFGESATVVEKHPAQMRPLFQIKAIMQCLLYLSHTADFTGTASQDSLVDWLTSEQSSAQRSARLFTNNSVDATHRCYASSAISPSSASSSLCKAV
jgi:hypothetical protein